MGAPDIARTKEHYLQHVGMTEVAGGGDASAYLSIGYNHHDLVLRPAKQKSLLNLGFQLKPHIELRDFPREARESGLPATIKSDSQPGVAAVVEVEAPGGILIQFYSCMDAPAPGFKQTGATPLRLGHVAVISPEGDKLIQFFQDFLGFCVTDDIAGIGNFLTCNRDHHVVNIVKAPASRLHHIAFELRDNSCHPIAADALRAAGVDLLWGPSRHTAGHNLAAYHYDPEKVLVEFYTEMDQFIPELGMCEPRPWHRRVPLKDLVPPGRFLLIAGEHGQDWCDAATGVAAADDLLMDAVRIGHIDGDLFDPRLAWAEFRGITEKGAVLVRPDRVVAWRSAAAAANPASMLAEALGTILGRTLRTAELAPTRAVQQSAKA